MSRPPCAGRARRGWLRHQALARALPGQADQAWLPAIGAAGWVLLTKDKNIRRNILEIEAILNAGVRAFVLTATELRKEQQAEIFLKAMKKICRICQQQRGPFIFNITGMGYLSRISTSALRRRLKPRAE